MSPKVPPKTQPIDEVLAPMFGPEAGRRFELMRKKRLLDQSQLAEKLGVSQQTISRIETGKLHVCDLLTFAKLRVVFEGDVHFILLGTGAERHSANFICQRYHEFKYVINRKGSKKTRGKFYKPGVESLTPQPKKGN